MPEYVLCCGSTMDITPEKAKERDLHYVSFSYEMDGTFYKDDLYQSMSADEFYQKLSDGAEVSTSQVNAETYKEFFEKFLKEGKDVLHIEVSSGISGSINSSTLAKTMLQEKYPDRKIYVIDSLCASSGYGMLMDKLADLRDEGKSIDEVASWVEDNKSKMHHWFCSSDLTQYVKGGRISKTSGLVGGILDICPVLEMDGEGKLTPRMKVRGKKKAIAALVDKMDELCDNGRDYNEKVWLCHSHCIDDAKAIAEMVKDKFKNIKGEIEIFDIGATIGCHSGIGTVAIFFWGKPRALA